MSSESIYDYAVGFQDKKTHLHLLHNQKPLKESNCTSDILDNVINEDFFFLLLLPLHAKMQTDVKNRAE